MPYLNLRSANAVTGNNPMVTASAMAGLAALWAAMLLLGADDGDRDILLALYAADEPALALAARIFTFFGEWQVLLTITVIVAGALLLARRARTALALLAVSLTSRAMVFLQKLWFARLRPEENIRMVEVNTYSFPSGHTANSMTVYLILALLLAPPRWRPAAVACAIAFSVLIGFSRPILGVHWPSDVVAGWSFGLFWVLLWWRVAGIERQVNGSPAVQAESLKH